MLYTDERMPVAVEVIDNVGQRLSSASALLCHLDGECARLRVRAGASPSGLHWGARLRFRVGAGAAALEVTGTLMDTDDATADADSEEDAENDNFDCRMLTLRLHTCQAAPQKRDFPRSRERFAVHISGTAASIPENSTDAPDNDRIPFAPCEVTGQCIDIGLGGMRIQVPASSLPLTRVALRFAVGEPHAPDSVRRYCLRGRVLRSAPLPRRPQQQEIAVKFESLDTSDRNALTAWLAQNSL